MDTYNLTEHFEDIMRHLSEGPNRYLVIRNVNELPVGVYPKQKPKGMLAVILEDNEG